MYDVCEVCGDQIVRDVLMDASAPGESHWLGACGCPSRKWRWRSPTGYPPWELMADPH